MLMHNSLYSPGPFTIFLVFSAGLLTSLGPCSLSLLPVTIAYMGGTEKTGENGKQDQTKDPDQGPKTSQVPQTKNETRVHNKKNSQEKG